MESFNEMVERQTMMELAAIPCGINLPKWGEHCHWHFYNGGINVDSAHPNFKGENIYSRTVTSYGWWWNPLSNLRDRYEMARSCGLCVNFMRKEVRYDVDGEERVITWATEEEEGLALLKAASEVGEVIARPYNYQTSYQQIMARFG